jgi:hypothetical protein
VLGIFIDSARAHANSISEDCEGEFVKGRRIGRLACRVAIFGVGQFLLLTLWLRCFILVAMTTLVIILAI